MNSLLGFVSDAIIAKIFDLQMERGQVVRTVRAVNKLLWIQNDLINRHYCTDMTVEQTKLDVTLSA